MTAPPVVARPIPFADLQRIKRISDPRISATGRWVLFSAVDVNLAANTKTSHLWVVPLDGSSPERQLTSTKDGESNGRFSPDGRHILFTATETSTGKSQIFIAFWDEAQGTTTDTKLLTH